MATTINSWVAYMIIGCGQENDNVYDMATQYKLVVAFGRINNILFWWTQLLMIRKLHQFLVATSLMC